MKTARQSTRDRHEDRFEREEKLGQAMDTLPGKTLRDRTPAARRDLPRSKARTVEVEEPVASKTPTAVSRVKLARPAGRFALVASDASTVHVAGSFNNWDPAATPLAKGIDGSWEVVLDLKPGAYEYLFIVDGNWQEDPKACDFVENPYGSRNCLMHVS